LAISGPRAAAQRLTPRPAVEEVAGMTPMRDAPAELWRMSATELAEVIRSRQDSSREVIEAHLRRIEKVDPEVNAVPLVLGEQALQAADAADRAVAVATGMSPLGLGNDGFGSLRHPAQCCGINVLKPGLGRVPDATTVAGARAGAIGAQLKGPDHTPFTGPAGWVASPLGVIRAVVTWGLPSVVAKPHGQRPVSEVWSAALRRAYVLALSPR